MYKFVDNEQSSDFQGFAYRNKYGSEEYVNLLESIVEICVDSVEVEIYYEDLPKLIKALQEAYDYKGIK